MNDPEHELSEISNAIGSIRWMDPPDGGDVSLAEQVRRMRSDLERAEGVLSEILELIETSEESDADTINYIASICRGVRT